MSVVETKVASAVVYPDRARITRRGNTSLQKGLQMLEIRDLPLQLNPESLRISARGTARALLLGAQVRRAFYAESPAEQVRRLEEEIESLQDSLKDLDAKAKLIEQSRSALEKIANHSEVYATALAANEMSLQEQLALFDGLRERFEKLNGEVAEIIRARREGERCLQKLNRELDSLRSARPRERYTASVEVEMLDDGDLTVDLQYVISGASWQPFYDLRLLEADGEITLEVGYLAEVKQDTGEVWQDVALSLSTARPALSQTLPELKPWYIRPTLPVAPSPLPVRAKMAAATLGEAASDEAIARSVAEEAQAQVAEAVVESGGMALNYLIPGSVTIPPDGALHKVTVGRFPLIPQLDYVSAPKLVEAVYRRAKVNNLSPYTLLHGKANLFVGDEFVGTTPLEMTAPGGEIELYLGVEDRIKIKRELKRREVDKRFIGSKRRIVYGYEIELESLLPGASKVTVLDQFPVSQNEEIRVYLDSAEPKPSEVSELNILRWDLTLQPKEKRRLRFDFGVESPQQMQVIGLP